MPTSQCDPWFCFAWLSPDFFGGGLVVNHFRLQKCPRLVCRWTTAGGAEKVFHVWENLPTEIWDCLSLKGLLSKSLNAWPWSNGILKTCTQHGPSKIQSQTIVLCVLECHNIAFKGDAIAMDTANEAWFSGNMGRRSPCHSNSKNPVTRETKIFINVWFIITPCGARVAKIFLWQANSSKSARDCRPLLNTKKSPLLWNQS